MAATTDSHGYYLLCLEWVNIERAVRDGKMTIEEGAAALADIERRMHRTAFVPLSPSPPSPTTRARRSEARRVSGITGTHQPRLPLPRT